MAGYAATGNGTFCLGSWSGELEDCAGLNVLVATRRRAQLEGGWVRLVRVPPQARRMISLLKLDWAFGLGTLGSVA